MVTWTTYGSWLQGDKRKYVKDGKVLDGDEHIYSLCKKLQKWPAVKLTSKEKIGEAREDIESEEERNKMEGRPFEAIAFTYEYLEQFSYNTEVIPETLWQSSQAINMALSVEKVGLIKGTFPEYFAANREILFKDLIKNYNDDPERYKIPESMSFEDEKALELAGGAMKGKGGTTQGQVVSDISGVDKNNRLSSMMGTEK